MKAFANILGLGRKVQLPQMPDLAAVAERAKGSARWFGLQLIAFVVILVSGGLLISAENPEKAIMAFFGILAAGGAVSFAFAKDFASQFISGGIVVFCGLMFLRIVLGV